MNKKKCTRSQKGSEGGGGSRGRIGEKNDEQGGRKKEGVKKRGGWAERVRG